MRLIFTLFFLLTALPGFALPQIAPRETPPSFPGFAQVESHRIRIENAKDGAVQVSTDGGQTWRLVGRVTQPATSSVRGYLAAGYAKPGTVSATAVHGLRVRVGDLKSAYPSLVSILPREFAQTSGNFGGHVAGSSGLYTNIPTGTGIFRELAPCVGNPVLLERDSVGPLPVGYSPHAGDILVIVVMRPAVPLHSVEFVNKRGGPVTATFSDGSTKTVCQVVKPVLNVGRFDGTSYTGVGAINTNHCGVITVSTAPVTTSSQTEGVGPERRGGFQIEPSYHNAQSEEAGAPMILVVGNPDKRWDTWQEGTPPLFDGYLDLAWSKDDPEHSWRTEIQKSGSSAWLPLPQSIAPKADAFKGVTALRLIRDTPGDAAWVAARADAAVKAYYHYAQAQDKAAGVRVAHGRLTVGATISDPNVHFISFAVDGSLRGLTSERQAQFHWNTTDSPDGEYVMEISTLDASGKVLSTTRSKVWVDNTHQTAER